MAVIVRNAVFCDVAPCACYDDRRFGETFRLNLQGRKQNVLESVSNCLTIVLALVYFFHPEDGGDIFVRNVGFSQDPEYGILEIPKLRRYVSPKR
jgi:hypothetical protein